MMVGSTTRFSHLVLIDPLGIKISGREERDIADMHAISRAEYLRFAWADPAKGDIDFTKLPESELAAIARGREAFALYGWKPYVRIRGSNAGSIGSTSQHCCCRVPRTAS